MERRATVLPRFAKKSTSSWLKGALQAYACSCARISGGRILLLYFASAVSAARSNSTEYGTMERRATVLPRFAKKSTSSWLKGALQAYACSCPRIFGGRILLLYFASAVSAARYDSTEYGTWIARARRKWLKVTTRGSQVKARTKEVSLQTLELGLVLIDTKGKTCVMDALDAT
ncbi:hypothetical protein Tco_1566861 [Tanacetum coccineum]